MCIKNRPVLHNLCMKYTLPDAQNCLFKWQQDKFFKNGKTGYKGSEASVYVFSWQKQFYDKQAWW